jgi:3-phenylpropionate/cinnamic acid dioxygenase small subunit
MLDNPLCRRVERFVFEEARLLDAGQFKAWLRLYEPEGIYWMPRFETKQPTQHSSLMLPLSAWNIRLISRECTPVVIPIIC